MVSDCVGKIRHSYSTTNVTTGAWVELTNDIPDSCSFLEIFSSSGSVLKLGVGAAGSEEELDFYILPGGNVTLVPARLLEGQRLAVRAVDANATSGQLVINLYA